MVIKMSRYDMTEGMIRGPLKEELQAYMPDRNIQYIVVWF